MFSPFNYFESVTYVSSLSGFGQNVKIVDDIMFQSLSGITGVLTVSCFIVALINACFNPFRDYGVFSPIFLTSWQPAGSSIPFRDYEVLRG